MAEALVVGALVGSLCQELLKVTQNVAIKTVTFKSILRRLESRLNQIAPMIEDNKKLNKLLDRPKNEIKLFEKQLADGSKLVQKCAKIKWGRPNCVFMPYYARKLEGLEDSLLQFFQIEVPLQILTYSKENSLGINEMNNKLSRLETAGVGFGGSGGFMGICSVPGAPEFVVGFEEPLRELKRKMIDERERVLVLSAPGGCGKTTLVKMFCRDKDVVDIYKENIFFVTFSKTPNIKVVINNMFKHKSFPTPEYHTEEEAFNQLEQMLRQMGSNPILVVLDDVWPGSESYVEKFKFQIQDYKILVTSRSRLSRFSSYKLKLLNDQDAMKLFLHSAFPQGDGSRISPDVVNKIVRECGGFPLALEVVGRSLCGRDEVMWRQMLKKWSKGKSIFSSNNDLFIHLQSSIDALDDIDYIENVKNCYLDLSSFPEDQRIPVTIFIDMWAELYDFDDDGDEAYAILNELSDRNLVNLVLPSKDAREIQGCYNEHFVTQHDILRELAVHNCEQNCIYDRDRLIVDIRDNHFPKWWIEQSHRPISAQLVSISSDGLISNWHNLEFSKVKVLVLNIQAENDTLPQFLEKMNNLKALIITNNDLRSAEISNFSVIKHLQNLKRINLKHFLIKSVNSAILKLKSLRKLSLTMCKFNGAVMECDIQLPNMPNLVEIMIDYCSDLVELPTWLCNIKSLEEISIMNCHDLISLPREVGNLENLKTLRLSSCTTLEELPETIGNLKKLHFLDLSDCINITELPESIGELSGLRKVNMRGCGGLSELPVSVKELENLENVICDYETANLWEGYKDYFPNLKIDVVKEVPNLDWLH